MPKLKCTISFFLSLVRYPILVLQFPIDEEFQEDLELKVEDAEVKEKFADFGSTTLKGPVYEAVARLLKTLTGRKVFICNANTLSVPTSKIKKREIRMEERIKKVFLSCCISPPPPLFHSPFRSFLLFSPFLTDHNTRRVHKPPQVARCALLVQGLRGLFVPA